MSTSETRRKAPRKPAQKRPKPTKPKQEKKKIGRKPYWTEERKAIAMDVICEQLSTTEKSLTSICSDFPEVASLATVMIWLSEDTSFQERYARAREAQADINADEIVKIADTEEDANKARVRIDARKWAAGKRAPQKYGDRLELAGELKTKLSDEQLDTRLAHLLGKARAAIAAGGEGAQEDEA